MTPTPDPMQRARALLLALNFDWDATEIESEACWMDAKAIALEHLIGAEARGAAREREACANLLEQRIGLSYTLDDELREIAKAIRRRGGTQ